MKIGFLGVGNMAKAIVTHLLTNKLVTKSNIKLIVHSEISYQNFVRAKMQVAVDWNFLNDCAVIFLCLKPQDIINLQDKLRTSFSNKIIISLAAGITLATLNQIFINNQVTRIMTNLAIANDKTSLMVTKEGHQSANNFIKQLFAQTTNLLFWKEINIHLFITLCGSANAFIYYFLQPFSKIGLEHNLPETEIKDMIALLLNSCASTISASDWTLKQLIDQVCSKDGTTIAGINSFENNKLQDIIKQGLLTCLNRSKKLEDENSK